MERIARYSNNVGLILALALKYRKHPITDIGANFTKYRKK